MKKKIIYMIITVIVVIAAIYIAFILTNKKVQAPQSLTSIVLYWGSGCTHCLNVDKFIDENKVADKIDFEKKEVFNDTNNAQEMVAKARACGLNTDSLGVPMLSDGSTCHVGDVEVIKFFTDKLNIK